MNKIQKHYYSWQDIENMCVNIVTQMYRSNWRPDYIVGITRGGNVPATIISNMTGIRCETLKVSFRDDDTMSESNSWMSEDASGYIGTDTDEHRKNILIVDDINDTGNTFNWITEDWQNEFPDCDWNSVWNHNVRFAVLTENLSSSFHFVDYYSHDVNKSEEDVWLIYPWENVGEY